MKSRLLTAFVSLLMILLAGCAFTAPKVTIHRFLDPSIASYHAPCLGAMRRVAVLPIDFDEQNSAPNDLDMVFHTELNKTSAFEVVPVSRSEMVSRFGIAAFSSVQTIPGDLLARLAQEYGVDGVLFTDVTHYFPYRPLAIGVRCKLVDVRSGEQRWAFDHMFDSGAPDIAVSAKNFWAQQESEQSPILNDGEGILDSPSQFGKYVAHETYRSLLGI